MNILALETIGTAGSVAALARDALLAEMTLETRRRTTQTLVPAMQTLLGQVGWKPRDVDLVAVARGPGSFTGLRVGVTTAKAFAYAAGAEVLGVDSLEAIACRAPDDCSSVEVVVDAQRQQVYAAAFARDASGWMRPGGETRIIDVPKWLAGLRPGTVSGPALARLAPQLPEGVQALDCELWNATAAAVGRLACRDHQAGRRDDLWQLVPDYVRRSAAEEKWEQKQKDAGKA